MPDLHGSVAAALDGSATTTRNALRYDAYGQTVATGGPGGVGAGFWKYGGRLDVSPITASLYDVGARLYAPALGAFTQLDTYAGSAVDPLSLNRYLYALANPATLVDPDGHSPVSFIDQEGTGQAITNTLVRHLAAVGRGTNRSALRRAEASAEDRYAHHRVGNTSSTRSGGAAAWAPPSYVTWLAWDPDRQNAEALAHGAAARALVEAHTFDLANPAVVYLAGLHQVMTDRAAAIDNPILVSTTYSYEELAGVYAAAMASRGSDPKADLTATWSAAALMVFIGIGDRPSAGGGAGARPAGGAGTPAEVVRGAGESLPAALTIGRNAERGVHVYQGITGGESVYVGNHQQPRSAGFATRRTIRHGAADNRCRHPGGSSHH